ncbi:MAG: hypothetical protein K5888_07980 [Lachnospiraceae bacterium]|nr:hypothetical protein [Lachnospiraceae bacterium]
MKKHILRSILCLLMIFLLIPSVAGCTAGDSAEASESDEEDEEEEDRDKEEAKEKKKHKKKKAEEDGKEDPEQDSEEVDITTETASEATPVPVNYDISPAEISNMQIEILCRYLEAQENACSEDELYEMDIYSGLESYGWPQSVNPDTISYLFYDVNSDGINELIIEYCETITDIWGYDGVKMHRAFGTGSGSIVMLHEDGMLEVGTPYTDNGDNVKWYKFDAELGDYFPAFEAYYNEEAVNEFYTFCFDENSRQEVVQSYRDYGYYPVWVEEWGHNLTEEEYNDLCSDAPVVTFDDRYLLSDLDIPETHERHDFPNGRLGMNGLEKKKEITITEDMQYEANIFISNFVEQYQNGDEYHSISYDSDVYKLVRFVTDYYDLNDFEQLEGSYLNELSLKKVNKELDRFFGIKLTEDQAAEFYNDEYATTEYYEDGVFHFINGDGDPKEDIAVVYEMNELSDGNYEMNFFVYSPDLDYLDEGGETYHLTSKEAMSLRDKKDLYWKAKGTAYVKPHKYNNRNTYQMISMEVYSNK